MAGQINTGVKEFEGRLKLAGASTVTVKGGYFVSPDYSDGEMDLITADATGRIFMVHPEVDTANGRLLDDVDFVYTGGQYVKALNLKDGMIIETTAVGSTYASVAVDNEMGVGDGGTVKLIADLDATDFTAFKFTFTVKEKTTLWGEEALKLVVNMK